MWESCYAKRYHVTDKLVSQIPSQCISKEYCQCLLANSRQKQEWAYIDLSSNTWSRLGALSIIILSHFILSVVSLCDIVNVCQFQTQRQVFGQKCQHAVNSNTWNKLGTIVCDIICSTLYCQLSHFVTMLILDKSKSRHSQATLEASLAPLSSLDTADAPIVLNTL